MVRGILTDYTHERLRELIAALTPPVRMPLRIRIVRDTTDFFRVEYDDIVILGDRPYLIRNNRREGRFGIADQPKFWVKSAIDLLTGETKILKMVYYEKFRSRIGDLTFECFRSPKKEARILTAVKGNPDFMQGFSINDEAGNIIRVLDYIEGPSLDAEIEEIDCSHQEYFYTMFPSIFDSFITLTSAIGHLHNLREKHGDIRRDHIIHDRRTGRRRWIDFDFNYMHRENMFGYDLFGLGNVLIFITGKGDITTQYLRKDNNPAFSRLSSDDLNIIFHNRVVNLRKIYPYIPEKLNNVLMHFSTGANIFYSETIHFIEDVQEARDELC